MEETIEDMNHIHLENGLDLYLEDDDEVQITLRKDGQLLSKVVLPWPSSGYGGGSLIVSDSQNYLVFSYYSGQSEEAFKLYQLTDEINEIFSLNYQFGEAASFGFNQAESTLLMAYPLSCSEWWQPWEDDDLEVSESGERFLYFGDIKVLDIKRNSITHHEIKLKIPNGWEPSTEEYSPYLLPSFTPENSVDLSMPWGKMSLRFPFGKNILIDMASKASNA
ncbi:hypothetical protein MJO52_08180 [Microbulbifer variabilis]|uniref:Carbohydrate-binding domain-containing protein n=1 Tax=Microbulbifer variabilis TaxID=266805 RepID=A0ABY4VFY6_9GAMM|nr:hypothetical protein [Microbulbifer variabilis]USD23099.1 hypothetical protein MJO52_08180 [Microbulbifer variabilis]